MKKKKTFGSIIFSISKVILTIFLVFMLAVVIIQKVTRNNLAIGGYRIFSIVSNSMHPNYGVGDILVSKATPPEKIEVGDDVTYLGKEGDFAGLIVTHKVYKKYQEDGKYIFITKGIANDIADPEITEDDIYGKIIYKTIVFSFIGKLMDNIIVYYGLFVVVGVYVSYQIIKIFFIKDEDVEDELSTSSKEGN